MSESHPKSDTYVDKNGLLTLQDQQALPLTGRPGQPPSVHLFTTAQITAVNAAISTGRALLVRGEPGTGKTQLARAVAMALGRELVQTALDSRTESRDLLWHMDHVARLARAQALGVGKQELTAKQVDHKLAQTHFIRPGPIWRALTENVVCLIDEIDKADPSVPNGLLDALGQGGFDIPGYKRVDADPDIKPLVILTTNEERTLPDAFLRRCWVLPLSLPKGPALVEHLIRLGRLHHGESACCELLQQAAERLVGARERAQDLKLSAPGLAEYLDLIQAAVYQRPDKDQQIKILIAVSDFALHKHPAVIQQVEQERAAQAAAERANLQDSRVQR